MSNCWGNFRNALVKAYGNVNPEKIARSKLRGLSQTGTIEDYANDFQNLCAQIVSMHVSEGDKIDRFTAGLKPEMQMLVAADPSNDGQSWSNFGRLVQYAVSLDASRAQVKSQTSHLSVGTAGKGLSIGNTPRQGHGDNTKGLQNGKASSIGPVRTPKKAIRFSYGREVDYQRATRLKKEGKCYYCEEHGHLAAACPKNPSVKKDF